MHPYLIVLSISFMLTSIAQPADAALGNDDCSQQMVALLSEGTGSRPTAAVAAAVARHIDYEYITEYAVGPTEWSRLDDSQRRQCIRLVRRWLEDRHYPRWHKLFLKGKYKELSTTQSGNETLVRASLLQPNKRYILTWRLHNRGQTCRVISLSVNGKDLLNRLKGRFQRQLNRGGHGRLVASLTNSAARGYLTD